MVRMEVPRALSRRMDLVLFGGGEAGVGDVVPGKGAFHGDRVHGVRFRDHGCGRRGGVGVDVVPGQRWQPALCGGVGLSGVSDGTLLACRPRRPGVLQPRIEDGDVVGSAGGDRLAGHASLQAGGAAAELGGKELGGPAEGDQRLQATAGAGRVDAAARRPAGILDADAQYARGRVRADPPRDRGVAVAVLGQLADVPDR
jgi:hypothetical protein